MSKATSGIAVPLTANSDPDQHHLSIHALLTLGLRRKVLAWCSSLDIRMIRRLPDILPRVFGSSLMDIPKDTAEA